MNAGAAVATGRNLLFLHADSLPPKRFHRTISQILAFPGVSMGAFALRIDAPGRLFRVIEWGANLRSRWLATPYGDQGLFLRRETWDALGGFQELPILEDYALVRAARNLGPVVTTLEPVRTSARRWKREGTVRLSARNILTYIAFPLGVSPERIARWYGGS